MWKNTSAGPVPVPRCRRRCSHYYIEPTEKLNLMTRTYLMMPKFVLTEKCVAVFGFLDWMEMVVILARKLYLMHRRYAAFEVV